MGTRNRTGKRKLI